MDAPIDYKAVLADLKARRDALDKVIENLQIVVTLGALTNYNVFAPTVNEIHVDAFVGRNIQDATAEYLRLVGRPARTTQEIQEALTKGGLPCSTGSVATVLGRESVRSSSEVVRAAKGLWGLASWYPSRPRSSKRREGEAETGGNGAESTASST